MVLHALRCLNDVDLEKKVVNDNIVLDVFIICQKLHVKVILKNTDWYTLKVISQNINSPLPTMCKASSHIHSARRLTYN